jgi:hypothetical protein
LGALSLSELLQIVILDVDDIVIFTNLSHWVSSVFLDRRHIVCQLILELGNILLFNWVDGGHDIPVNVLGAWRSGDGTSVDPSIVSVDEGKKICVKDPVNWCSGSFISDCIHIDVFKEVINDFLLGPSQLGVIVINGEHDTNSCGNIPVSWVSDSRIMNRMHFEVSVLSIDGMLRLGVEMELKSVILLWGTIDLLGDVGSKCH